MNENYNNQIATRPAQMLLNETVGTGWKVVSQNPVKSSNIDGKYSVCYTVEKDGQKAFLKAVDLYDATTKVCDKFEELEKITRRANNEKGIAQLCSEFGMKNVVRYIESGEFKTKALDDPTIHYIIYEKAEKDGLAISDSFGGNLNEISIYQRLTLLHNITNALRAMHEKNITHQDVKPSNVLQFLKDGGEVFKIGDFDCAVKKSHLSLDDELNYQDDKHAGTYRYAPIELLYEYVVTDWDIVRKGADFYLLGSLICHYFTGRSMTELFYSTLGRSFLWERTDNKGKYEVLLPRIEEAFEICIDKIAKGTSFHPKLQEVICHSVRVLCHPNPYNRGELKWYGKEQFTLTLLPTLSKLGHLKDYFKGI